MTFRAAVLLLAATLPAAVSLHAQAGNFDIVLDGKVVGHSSFALTKAKQGFKAQGHTSYMIKPADVRSDNDYRYTDTYTFLQGSINDQNTQTLFSYTPDKGRTTLAVGSMRSGNMDTHVLPIKPDAMFLPSYDAGAAQAAILLALTHPTVSNRYSVIVPGARGPAAQQNDPHDRQIQAPQHRVGDNAYDAQWAKGADLTGTLDGKPVAVHVYTLMGQGAWTFYADDQNNLLEFESAADVAKCIRANFKLAGS